MTKKEGLLHPVVVTPSAYQHLQSVSRLSGLSLGELATRAVERAYNPKKNPEFAASLQRARAQLVDTIL